MKRSTSSNTPSSPQEVNLLGMGPTVRHEKERKENHKVQQEGKYKKKTESILLNIMEWYLV